MDHTVQRMSEHRRVANDIAERPPEWSLGIDTETRCSLIVNTAGSQTDLPLPDRERSPFMDWKKSRYGTTALPVVVAIRQSESAILGGR